MNIFRTYLFNSVLSSVMAVLYLTAFASAQGTPASSSPAELLYKSGYEKAMRSDDSGAIADLTAAIKLDPHQAKYFYFRGYCYAGSDNDKALADYDQALKLKPDYKEALFGRVFIHRMSDKQAAFADLDRIIAIDPTDTQAYGEKASLAIDVGSYDVANAAGSKLIELLPTSPAGYRYRGQAALHQKKYDQAVAFFTQALDRDARDTDALLGRSNAYRSLGNEIAANVDLEKWKEMTPELTNPQGGGIGTGRGEGVGPGVVPSPSMPLPKPPVITEQLKIISKPLAGYTEKARQNSISGTVSLRIQFLANGKIGAISVVRGLPDGLTEKAVEAARLITFIPAKSNGVAVTQTKILQFTFNIY